MTSSLGLVAGTAAGATAAVLGAAWRWRSASRALVSQLRADLTTARPVPADLERVPAPIARYFRTVLPGDARTIRIARLEQRGWFLARPDADGWRPFTAVEHFADRPPAFVWDAAIRMAPGISVKVRDGFVAGRGSMVASVLGLYRVVSIEGTPELDAGALQRFLAEAVWIPTALLPRDGLTWAPLDVASARATLIVGTTAASIDFHFGADGLVDRIYSPARPRDVGHGRAVPTPWRGRFRRYAESGGYLLPMEGEVEWVLPEGPAPYWRGRIASVALELDGAAAGALR